MATVVKTYAINISRDNTLQAICGRDVQEVSCMTMTSEAAGVELDRRVRRYAADHGQDLRTHYSDILHRIIEGAGDDLKEAYSGARVRRKREPTTPAEEVHARTEDYSREHGVDYSEVLRQTLKADPDLKEAYSR